MASFEFEYLEKWNQSAKGIEEDSIRSCCFRDRPSLGNFYQISLELASNAQDLSSVPGIVDIKYPALTNQWS